jgi:hypothetical protein
MDAVYKATHPDTGLGDEYKELLKSYKGSLWENACADEFGRLAQESYPTCPQAPTSCTSYIRRTCPTDARPSTSKLFRPTNHTKPSKNAYRQPLVAIDSITLVKPAPKPLTLSRSNYCLTTPSQLLAPSGCRTISRTSTFLPFYLSTFLP